MTPSEFKRDTFISRGVKITYVLRYDPNIKSDFNFRLKYISFLENFFDFSKRIIQDICEHETEFELAQDITFEIWLSNIGGKKVGRIIADTNPIIFVLNYHLFADWQRKSLGSISLHESVFHSISLRDFLSHELHHKFDKEFAKSAWDALVRQLKLDKEHKGVHFILRYIFFNIRSEALPAIMDFPHKIHFNLDSVIHFKARVKKLAGFEIEKVVVYVEGTGRTHEERLEMSLYCNAVLNDTHDDKHINQLFEKFAEQWWSSRSITHDVAIYCAFMIAYAQMEPDDPINDAGLKVRDIERAIRHSIILNSPPESVRRQAYLQIRSCDVLNFIDLFERAAKKLGIPSDLVPISIEAYRELVDECVRINKKLIDYIKKEAKLSIEHEHLSLKEFVELIHKH